MTPVRLFCEFFLSHSNSTDRHSYFIHILLFSLKKPQSYSASHIYEYRHLEWMIYGLNICEIFLFKTRECKIMQNVSVDKQNDFFIFLSLNLFPYFWSIHFARCHQQQQTDTLTWENINSSKKERFLNIIK